LIGLPLGKIKAMFKKQVFTGKTTDNYSKKFEEVYNEISALRRSVWILEHPPRFKYDEKILVQRAWEEKPYAVIYKGEVAVFGSVGSYHRQCYIEETGRIGVVDEDDLRR
jgi:hypothetical protein